MKILISGFQPFGNQAENSSQIIAQLLKTVQMPNLEIQTIILPVTFSRSFDILKTEIDHFKPDFVISLGLAGNRTVISLEKVAINFIHCEIPDNEGVAVLDQSILEGPAAYFSTLPIQAMIELPTPFPMEFSFSAGTYVCNYVMFRLLDYLKDTQVKAGFIHLPHLNENRDQIFESLVSVLKLLRK